MTRPAIGASAPDFCLPNQDERPTCLKDFSGRHLVLYFYPKAMTPGCTVQACGMRDVEAELAKWDAAIVGVSPDAPRRLRNFVDKHHLNFHMLSDENHEIAERYGVWSLKKFMGREFFGVKRTTFIVNPVGKVAVILDSFTTGSHHNEVVEWFRSHAKV